MSAGQVMTVTIVAVSVRILKVQRSDMQKRFKPHLVGHVESRYHVTKDLTYRALSNSTSRVNNMRILDYHYFVL